MIVINSANNYLSSLTKEIIINCLRDIPGIHQYGVVRLPSSGYRYKKVNIAAKMFQIEGTFVDKYNMYIDFDNHGKSDEHRVTELIKDEVVYKDLWGEKDYPIQIIRILPSYESKVTFDWLRPLVMIIREYCGMLVEAETVHQIIEPPAELYGTQLEPIVESYVPTKPRMEPEISDIPESNDTIDEEDLEEMNQPVRVPASNQRFSSVDEELTKEEDEEIGDFARKFQEEEVARKNADPSNIKVSRVHNAIYVTKWLLKPDLSIKARQEPLVYGIPDLMRYRELGMLSSIEVPSCVEKFLDEYDYRGDEVLGEYEQM